MTPTFQQPAPLPAARPSIVDAIDADIDARRAAAAAAGEPDPFEDKPEPALPRSPLEDDVDRVTKADPTKPDPIPAGPTCPICGCAGFDPAWGCACQAKATPDPAGRAAASASYAQARADAHAAEKGRAMRREGQKGGVHFAGSFRDVETEKLEAGKRYPRDTLVGVAGSIPVTMSGTYTPPEIGKVRGIDIGNGQFVTDGIIDRGNGLERVENGVVVEKITTPGVKAGDDLEQLAAARAREAAAPTCTVWAGLYGGMLKSEAEAIWIEVFAEGLPGIGDQMAAHVFDALSQATKARRFSVTRLVVNGEYRLSMGRGVPDGVCIGTHEERDQARRELAEREREGLSYLDALPEVGGDDEADPTSWTQEDAASIDESGVAAIVDAIHASAPAVDEFAYPWDEYEPRFVYGATDRNGCPYLYTHDVDLADSDGDHAIAAHATQWRMFGKGVGADYITCGHARAPFGEEFPNWRESKRVRPGYVEKVEPMPEEPSIRGREYGNEFSPGMSPLGDRFYREAQAAPAIEAKLWGDDRPACVTKRDIRHADGTLEHSEERDERPLNFVTLPDQFTLIEAIRELTAELRATRQEANEREAMQTQARDR